MTGAGNHVLDAFVHLMGPVHSVNAQLGTRKPPPESDRHAVSYVPLRLGSNHSEHCARHQAIGACTCSALPAPRKPSATPSW
jgi:hypothetical protein